MNTGKAHQAIHSEEGGSFSSFPLHAPTSIAREVL